MIPITIVNGIYKPTYNWVAPHCRCVFSRKCLWFSSWPRWNTGVSKWWCSIVRFPVFDSPVGHWMSGKIGQITDKPQIQGILGMFLIPMNWCCSWLIPQSDREKWHEQSLPSLGCIWNLWRSPKCMVLSMFSHFVIALKIWRSWDIHHVGTKLDISKTILSLSHIKHPLNGPKYVVSSPTKNNKNMVSGWCLTWRGEKYHKYPVFYGFLWYTLVMAWFPHQITRIITSVLKTSYK